MKKTNILLIMMDAIFLIVFNVIIFILMKERTNVFWISYGFIHFSYLMLLLSTVFIPKVKEVVVYGYPIVYISSVYFLVELLIGVFFFTIGKEYVNLAIVVQLIILALYGVILISNLIANEKTVLYEQERHEEVMYIKIATDKMDDILSKAQGMKLIKKIEQCYDAVKNSQVISHPSLVRLENEIMGLIENLEVVVIQNDDEEIKNNLEEILKLISERDRKIKLLKHK